MIRQPYALTAKNAHILKATSKTFQHTAKAGDLRDILSHRSTRRFRNGATSMIPSSDFQEERYSKSLTFPSSAEKAQEVVAVVDNSRAFRASANNNRGNKCGCEQSSSAERSLMRKLQMVDFAIIETVLYLDAYPNSRSALSHYNKLIAERGKLYEALAKSSQPVTHRDHIGTESWTWTDGPWPWENQAN